MASSRAAKARFEDRGDDFVVLALLDQDGHTQRLMTGGVFGEPGRPFVDDFRMKELIRLERPATERAVFHAQDLGGGMHDERAGGGEGVFFLQLRIGVHPARDADHDQHRHVTARLQVQHLVADQAQLGGGRHQHHAGDGQLRGVALRLLDREGGGVATLGMPPDQQLVGYGNTGKPVYGAHTVEHIGRFGDPDQIGIGSRRAQPLIVRIRHRIAGIEKGFHVVGVDIGGFVRVGVDGHRGRGTARQAGGAMRNGHHRPATVWSRTGGRDQQTGDDGGLAAMVGRAVEDAPAGCAHDPGDFLDPHDLARLAGSRRVGRIVENWGCGKGHLLLEGIHPGESSRDDGPGSDFRCQSHRNPIRCARLDGLRWSIVP